MATILLNIIAFSAYSVNASSVQLQATRTELVIFNNYSAARHTIVYKQSFKPVHNYYRFPNRGNSLANKCFNYTKLIKVKLAIISAQDSLPNLSKSYFHIKTIPNNPDEDTMVTTAV